MKHFYSYKNKMSEKDLNLEWNVGVEDLSTISVDGESLESNDIDEILESSDGWILDNSGGVSSSTEDLDYEISGQSHNAIDESVFLESWDNAMARRNVINDWDNFWSYLRWFFFSAILMILWVFALALFYSFDIYIKEAVKDTPDPNYLAYVDFYKDKYKSVKNLIWINGFYETPMVWSEQEIQNVNEIINATDIDYIEKKDLLSDYVTNLVRNVENRATYEENLKQDIAKQWFLPEELGILLSEEYSIDTIQRSLNALEIIKFSTATKVFMYMNTALSTISEMIRISWANVESLRELFKHLSARWEQDISSYVYLCYLNPFEVNASCNTIWDLDLYYNLIKDDSVDLNLFKNAMSAISQLLEKEDTSLFSITFNEFNTKDKSIQFNIEVFTNQEDEKALIKQWIQNPNIFILTNIINLLKQSIFIIWAEIDTKHISVDPRTLDQWNFSRQVNYSTKDFVVPIQKNTEREIFDYIDLESMKKLLMDRWFKEDIKLELEEKLKNDSEDAMYEEIEWEENDIKNVEEDLELAIQSENDELESNNSDTGESINM